MLFYSKGKVGTLYITIETFSKRERRRRSKNQKKKKKEIKGEKECGLGAGCESKWRLDIVVVED